MDTYRGSFIDRGDDHNFGTDAWPEADFSDDEAGDDLPPGPVGQDERRMQVRAYNHWASLLDNRNFPSIEDLEPEALPDFGPYSVLLDFTQGLGNPSIRFLGDKLAAECGADCDIETLDDVPSRSLLSRITDHYMQILANQAPIGFEAEFVNQRQRTILYRGILLPYSSDDETIDFIYGVINWKELADQKTTDDLLKEIDEALDSPSLPDLSSLPDLWRTEPMADWADGPADMATAADSNEEVEDEDEDEDDVLDLVGYAQPEETAGTQSGDLPQPNFAIGGWASIVAAEDGQDDDDAEAPASLRPIDFASIKSQEFAPASIFEAVSADSDVGSEMGLADWLASARALAEAASGSEDRSRSALYAAIGRAYDFSLAAAQAPGEFAELIADSGLAVQDRAPMTPVVKLVFGPDYDKTRLTEYATALSHGHRLGLARGALASHLAKAPGGLKGVLNEERRIKREESGKPADRRDAPRAALARKLRKLDHAPLAAVSAEGSEFTLLVARRLPTGEVVLLGEVADDIPLLERAARRLIG